MDDEQLWFEAGDRADLTFDTGETIPAMWTRPKGTHAGWVLATGERHRARPRTLAHIAIVYPPERVGEEHVVHPDLVEQGDIPTEVDTSSSVV